MLDIVQVVIHDRHDLGMLIEIPDAAESDAGTEAALFLANDLPMLAIRQNARHATSTLGLDGIQYLPGVRDREVVA